MFVLIPSLYPSDQSLSSSSSSTTFIPPLRSRSDHHHLAFFVQKVYGESFAVSFHQYWSYRGNSWFLIKFRVSAFNWATFHYCITHFVKSGCGVQISTVISHWILTEDNSFCGWDEESPQVRVLRDEHIDNICHNNFADGRIQGYSPSSSR